MLFAIKVSLLPALVYYGSRLLIVALSLVLRLSLKVPVSILALFISLSHEIPIILALATVKGFLLLVLLH